MKTLGISTLFAVGTLLVSPVLQANGVRSGLATISEVNGVVLVSEGGRFSTAAEGGGLIVGSRLLTMEGAAATVVYGDGCQLEVAPNTMVVFREANECTSDNVDSKATGQQYASLGAPSSTAAASAGTAATTTAAVNSSGAMGGSRSPGEPGLFGVPAAGVLAGAGAVGVLGYFVLNDSNGKDNDRSVSASQ